MCTQLDLMRQPSPTDRCLIPLPLFRFFHSHLFLSVVVPNVLVLSSVCFEPQTDILSAISVTLGCAKGTMKQSFGEAVVQNTGISGNGLRAKTQTLKTSEESLPRRFRRYPETLYNPVTVLPFEASESGIRLVCARFF